MVFPWGLDFGNQNCVVAIARKGGIDVIDNEASSRKTPCMVGLGSNQRSLGEAARSKINTNLKQTCAEIKRLIGRRWNEPELQADLARMPFKVSEGPNGGLSVNLMYEKDGAGLQMHSFTPEQLLAMLFVNLKMTAEAHNKAPSPEVVISVPCWFTDAQRRAVLDAAQIAGLNCLRLMNETAATALAWGLPRSPELPEDSAKPKHALFFDMGHSSTQVSVVAFTKSKMQVLATGYARNVGGRDVDWAMLNYFAEEWKAKTKLDLFENPKSVVRLLAAIDKVKQQLSGYTTLTSLPVNVECLQDDRDLQSKIDTDKLQELTKELIEKAMEPVKQVIADSKLTFDDIEEIEVVGSATRSPLVTNAIKDFLGREPKRTMNSEEAVSKGCALMAAMVSPQFRVREFSVQDATPYPISLSWSSSSGADMDVEQKAGGNVVFNKYNIIPSIKMLTFMRKETFDITATYAEESLLPPGTNPVLGQYVVSGIPAAADGGASKVKVKVRLDANGCLSVDSAQALEDVEAEAEAEEEKKEEAKPEAAEGEKAEEKPADGDTPMPDAEAKKDEKSDEPKKKKVKKIDLGVRNNATFALTPVEVDKFKQVEYEMSVQDRQIRELQERKNDLETYIYEMRDKVSGGKLDAYMSQADKDKFLPMLDQMENWLYEEEAETANKSTFISKLDELKVFGAPCEQRYLEDEERPMAIDQLRKVIDEYMNLAATQDPLYEHITAEDRGKVKTECETVAAWLSGKEQEQAAKSKTENPATTCKELLSKKDNLIYTCRPIMMKPKPAPPKPAPKPEENKDAKADEKPAEGAAPEAPEPAPEGQAPAAEPAPEGGDAMEQS